MILKNLLAVASMAALAGAIHQIPGPSTQKVEPELRPGPLDYLDSEPFNRDRIAAAEEKRRRKVVKKSHPKR